MPKSEPLRRYIIIVNKLSTGQHPTLLELKGYLEQHDILVSRRTLQRDLTSLRYNFSIDVQYDSTNQGYYLEGKKDFSFINFMQLTQAKLRSDLFTNTINQKGALSDYVSFDSRDAVKGLEYIEPLLQAIKSQYHVNLVYHSFFKEKETMFKLMPYHLREFDGRWYLVGITDKSELVFGLDRIVSLETTAKKFNRNTKIDPKERFDNIIGISWGEGKLETIKLHFSVEQTKYIKSLPLHSSQVIDIENENGSEVTLTLEPNFEFMRRLMALGSAVKVKSPNHIAEQISSLHKEAFSQY